MKEMTLEEFTEMMTDKFNGEPMELVFFWIYNLIRDNRCKIHNDKELDLTKLV